MSLRVHIEFSYEFNAVSLAGFKQLAEVVKTLEEMGVPATVSVAGADAPAPAPAKARAGGVPRKTAPAPPAPKVNGPEAASDEDELETELAAPGLSETEALDRALALVRQVYIAGHKREVKGLQQEFAVAKFADVPADQGHHFLKRVLELAERMGMRP